MRFAAIALLMTSVSGFTFTSTQGRAFSSSALNAKVIVYYSTLMGRTKIVAEYIRSAVNCTMKDIGDASTDEIMGYDSLIIGTPTWHTGADKQRSGTSWDDFLYDTLPGMDLSSKKVAVFGIGDQKGYSDNYCDAAGELYDLFSIKGCTMFGLTSTEGYNHVESKAEVDGKFCGLMFDEHNEEDMSEDRARAWVAQLKEEGFF